MIAKPKSSSPTKRTNMTKETPDSGGRKTFPLVIHQMLSQAERDSFTHIVSWQPHGRAFRIHKHKEFMQSIMPDLFRQSKWSSFQRQLNLYGFKRITGNGPDKGSYYHELFLRGQPEVSRKIIRCRVKGTKRRVASNPNENPDFYAMTPLLDRYHHSDDDSRTEKKKNNAQKTTREQTHHNEHHDYDTGHHHHYSCTRVSRGYELCEPEDHNQQEAQHSFFSDEDFIPSMTVTPPGSRSTSLSTQSQKTIESNTMKHCETESMSLASVFRRSFMRVEPRKELSGSHHSKRSHDSNGLFPPSSPVESSSKKSQEQQDHEKPQLHHSTNLGEYDGEIDYILSNTNNDLKNLFSSIEGGKGGDHLHDHEFELMDLDFPLNLLT